ncbi:MAG TPA: hypothetical protein VHZ95_07325, partial [Polyangiales bacterium]|nr:hypothetical protein [Polyangiales bacterium]
MARTRVKSLSGELAQEQDPKLRAAIAYEIGALVESRLADRTEALEHYRFAADIDPSFRPALFALRRLYRESRDDEALVRVLANAVSASTTPTERASSLVDLGCLLEDHLNDSAGARGAFERAVAADPRSTAALLMLERSLFGQNHLVEAQALVARRAAVTSDPRLRSALACEAALNLAERGEIDDAVETLLSALASPGRHWATLSMLARLAERHDRPLIAARANED